MPTLSEPASDERLEIQIEIQPGATPDPVPMRTAVLHFRNRSSEPLRIYLPRGEMFRAGISSLLFSPEKAPLLLVPEPHPHGVVITEEDFPLLGPGESRAFTQSFTIDPVARGGAGTARLEGFAAGSEIAVRWIYENQIDQWQGGAQTLDGPTRSLFGGEKIPHIWKGKLTAQMRWRVGE